ncbi:MAG: hypothetical protein R3E90_10395 [Marinicella sp.]|nr:DNA-3-methyladenine glycosylase 2 family protein [Xanthomonadales bacterium]
MDKHQQAIDYIVKKEPMLLPVVEQFGVYELQADNCLNVFQAVSRTIIYQQLAGKAAASIHQKFKNLYVNAVPTAEQTDQMSFDILRSAGLSNAKAKAVMHLSQCVLDGSLPETEIIKKMSDADVVAHLTQIKGVGPWTANIALMFWLARPDIFPLNDLGLKKGLQKLYNLAELPDEQQTQHYAQQWQPYRTYASWYLWRILEL